MADSSAWLAKLLPAARSSSERAYSPYSRIRVGAALMDRQGRIITGCNVENASYGLTQCAEQSALCTAIDAGIEAGTIDVLLIYSTGFGSLSPCGGCRQVMSELMAADATVISCSDEAEPQYWTLQELLPDPFDL